MFFCYSLYVIPRTVYFDWICIVRFTLSECIESIKMKFCGQTVISTNLVDKISIPLISWTSCCDFHYFLEISASSAVNVHFFRGIRKSFPRTRTRTTTTNKPFIRPRQRSLAVKNFRATARILLIHFTFSDVLQSWYDLLIWTLNMIYSKSQTNCSAFDDVGLCNTKVRIEINFLMRK